jgi:hypothetical protein
MYGSTLPAAGFDSGALAIRGLSSTAPSAVKLLGFRYRPGHG